METEEEKFCCWSNNTIGRNWKVLLCMRLLSWTCSRFPQTNPLFAKDLGGLAVSFLIFPVNTDMWNMSLRVQEESDYITDGFTCLLAGTC